MIFDWFAREGGILISWWLLVTLAGVAVMPLLARVLRGLPDRGYTLARAAGLLLVGYVFWLLASLGFLRNTPGAVVLAWLIVLLVSVVVYWRGRKAINWREWWGHNRATVITGEVLFIVLLVGWGLVRAHQNSLTGTEKPMELMFMSAVQRSDIFPPHDGWLAGYAISYYYFGYVLAAVLSMMSGISSTIGFNMTITLLFALTGLTTFGVVANLVRSRTPGKPPHSALLTGLLGVVFVLLLSNLQPVLVEIPYQAQAVSEDYLGFWDTKNRDVYQPNAQPINLFNPDEARSAYLWWFNASRTLTERDLNGNRVNEVIDEFPAFSFMLADVHPHVLALPFAMLALGLALNVLLAGQTPHRWDIVFYGLILGGLWFLNAWDGPIYIVVLVGAEALRRLMAGGRLSGGDWWALVRLGGALALLTLVLYLPFFISFRSQAAGILPNVLHPTRFQQYFLMFGPFLLLLTPYLLIEIWRDGSRTNWRLGFQVAGLLLAVLAGLLLVFVLVGSLVPELRVVALSFVDQSGGWGAVLPALLTRRLVGGITTLVLLAGVVLVVARLFPRPQRVAVDEPQGEHQPAYPAATGFALLLIGAGLVLSLVPEFVYLRDNFGSRMNTIFKLYYQTWLVFSVAGAYAVYSMLVDAQLKQPAVVVRAAVTALLVAVLAVGLIYPVLGLQSRMFVETGRPAADRPLTLDGGPSLVNNSDYQSIMCFNRLVEGSDLVVAEAVGPAYNSGYGRVAALTGVPIVLGWENHQRQWRGPTYNALVGSRAPDMQELYSDLRWDVAQEIIQRYDIDYIFFGSSERAQYGSAGEDKFIENLEMLCDFDGSRFYRANTARQVVSR